MKNRGRWATDTDAALQYSRGGAGEQSRSWSDAIRNQWSDAIRDQLWATSSRAVFHVDNGSGRTVECVLEFRRARARSCSAETMSASSTTSCRCKHSGASLRSHSPPSTPSTSVGGRMSADSTDFRRSICQGRQLTNNCASSALRFAAFPSRTVSGSHFAPMSAVHWRCTECCV